jgi:hypothetical protein
LAGPVKGILTKKGARADECSSEENKACDLQPKLTQDAAEVHRRGLGAFHDCAYRPGTPGVLRRDASRYAQFTYCRHVHHERRF